MIVGIAGYKNTGKNTAAEALVNGHGFEEYSFAGPIKKACSAAFDIPYAVLEHTDKKDAPFPHPMYIDEIELFGLIRHLQKYQPITNKDIASMILLSANVPLNTPRALLQFIGTELVRAVVDTNFWTNALLKSIADVPNAVVTDARFPNERAALRTAGAKLVRIDRPGQTSSGHSSESSMGDDSEYDLVISNSGSIADLHNKMNGFYVGVSALKRIGL